MLTMENTELQMYHEYQDEFSIYELRKFSANELIGYNLAQSKIENWPTRHFACIFDKMP